jgi:hypothetical protein
MSAYSVAIFCHRRPTRATPREGRRTEKGQRGISRNKRMSWKGYGWMRAEAPQNKRRTDERGSVAG